MRQIKLINRIEIRNAAKALREDLGIDEDVPIKDIEDLIKNAGYSYLECPFPDNNSGYSKYLGQENYEIGFNLNHYFNNNFKRFTLAHEVGHVIMPAHNKILKDSGELRSMPEYKSDQSIEKEADYFAISFLAPEKTFKDKIQSMQFKKDSIECLSSGFGISLYAATLRYLELTELVCSVIVCNESGRVEYEQRSETLNAASSAIPFRYREPLDGNLQNRIKSNSGSAIKVNLSDWYPGVSDELGATETVIKLGYNQKVLVLLEPDDNELEEYII